jgi:hypothetical protein
MRRWVFIVFGVATFVGASSPAAAVPILDIQDLENLELSRGHYGHSLIGTLDHAATDAAIVLESTPLSIVGTSGSGSFGDELSQGTMGSFVEGSAANGASCGSEPGSLLGCWDSLNLAFPGQAATGGSSTADDQRPSANQNSPDRLVEETEVPRQASAANPTAFILLMSGLAAAGFAGWRTFLRDRRSAKGRRRDIRPRSRVF